jgi:hypothetical protein
MNKRRLFLSACRATTPPFARQLFEQAPDCFSVLGPARDVRFNDAAIFWASFYHLMLASEQRRMKREDMKNTIQLLATAYNVPILCFFNSGGRVERYRYPKVLSLRELARRRRARMRSRKTSARGH